jgi:hypothetical protein
MVRFAQTCMARARTDTRLHAHTHTVYSSHLLANQRQTQGKISQPSMNSPGVPHYLLHENSSEPQTHSFVKDIQERSSLTLSLSQ